MFVGGLGFVCGVSRLCLVVKELVNFVCGFFVVYSVSIKVQWIFATCWGMFGSQFDCWEVG